MKLSQRIKDNLGISMLISAISLVFTFLVLVVRKKSLLQAMLVFAAAEGTVGALLVLERERKKEQAEAAANEEPEELFDEEESREAELRVRSVLGGQRDDEYEDTPAVRREIPRDEDATEADFQ